MSTRLPGLLAAEYFHAVDIATSQKTLAGKADLVEFHPNGTIYPVEFKRGVKRQKLHDDLQLAVQALRLEQMRSRPVAAGAIFHASSLRRREVMITPELKQRVLDTAQAIRAMLAAGR